MFPVLFVFVLSRIVISILYIQKFYNEYSKNLSPLLSTWVQGSSPSVQNQAALASSAASIHSPNVVV